MKKNEVQGKGKSGNMAEERMSGENVRNMSGDVSSGHDAKALKDMNAAVVAEETDCGETMTQAEVFETMIVAGSESK